MEDAKNFEEDKKPVKIWKFENEVSLNPESKKNDSYVKVWFEGKGGNRLVYEYKLKEGE